MRACLQNAALADDDNRLLMVPEFEFVKNRLLVAPQRKHHAPHAVANASHVNRIRLNGTVDAPLVKRQPPMRHNEVPLGPLGKGFGM